ncbi:MAG TPA: SDR family oxidoreductase [Gemmatimonadaceae bacterium]|nr:SDR family oxidoreductase [Gemmatimonadaceae bacterium]
MTPARAMAGGALAGRTALVTGASRGIGAAVARRLAASGARVALLARSEAVLHELAAEIGGGAVAVACDLRRSEAAEVARLALDRLGVEAPDVLVNNAGAFFVTPAHETSVDAFRELIELNLTAPFGFVRAFLPEMRRRGAGHIVTVGSIADRTAFAGNAAYAASKFGLRALHEVLRAELKGTGVRSSLVAPGPVDTPLWDTVDPVHRRGHTPRAEMLTADEVADAVHYAVTVPATVNVDELRLSRS